MSSRLIFKNSIARAPVSNKPNIMALSLTPEYVSLQVFKSKLTSCISIGSMGSLGNLGAFTLIDEKVIQFIFVELYGFGGKTLRPAIDQE
jgi:hypothetical protein